VKNLACKKFKKAMVDSDEDVESDTLLAVICQF
jgi:hypothetical protein